MKRLAGRRPVLLSISLIVIGLACALTDQIDRLRQGQTAVETVQGMATDINERGILETVQGMATTVDGLGIKETVQVLVTKAGQDGIRQTVQAIATDLVVEPGDLPPDIPIMAGEKFGFVGSEQVVSYSVRVEFPLVLAFYQHEMAANGWQVVELGTIISDNSADLYYQKPERQVHVVINPLPFVDQISVVISMQ